MNITEKEHKALVFACLDARDKGDMEQAKALDILARKASADLTNKKYAGLPIYGKRQTWRSLKSILLM